MEKDMRDFLSVLCRAIHGKQCQSYPADTDPASIIHIAKMHKVMPLIIRSEMDNTDFFSHSVYDSARSEALSSVVAQIRRTEIFKKLYIGMNANGIFPIVMKGIICRNLYGEMGDYRVSGDEDILVKKEDFVKIDNFLKSKGFVPDKDNLSEKAVDSLQEVTYTSPNNDLRLEVHLNPFGKDDSFRRKMNGYFEDVFDSYREEKSGDVALRTMTHTKHFLFLVLHAFKHLTVSGFGIRMVCDILLYLEKYKEEIDFFYVRDVFEEIGAAEFFEDLVLIGNKYLGFSLPSSGKVNCPEDLLEDILESGIYGNYSQARRTSVHIVHTALSKPKSGKAGLLWDTVFPPKERLLDLCPELESKPWLIFDVYIKRIGRFISHNRQSGDNLAAESMRIGNKRIELIKKYKLL